MLSLVSNLAKTDRSRSINQFFHQGPLMVNLVGDQGKLNRKDGKENLIPDGSHFSPFIEEKMTDQTANLLASASLKN